MLPQMVQNKGVFTQKPRSRQGGTTTSPCQWKTLNLQIFLVAASTGKLSADLTGCSIETEPV